MKHLLSFNEAAKAPRARKDPGDLAGLRPLEHKLADDVWFDLKKAVNTGYITSYKIENDGWSDSEKLLALDDMIGVFGRKSKTLTITTVESDKPLTFELVEADATRMKYPPKPKQIPGQPYVHHNPPGEEVTYQHFVFTHEDRRRFSNIRERALEWVQEVKKGNKNILGEDGKEYPNREITNLAKRWCPSYHELIANYKYIDTTKPRQLTGGTIELSRDYGATWGLRPVYTISKAGRIYYSAASQKPNLLTTPPLMKIQDYEKCLKFLVQKEKAEEEKEKKKNR